MTAFVPDPGFEKAIVNQPLMRKALLAVAEDVVDVAGALAAEDTGHYRRTLDAVAVSPGRARALSGDIAGHLIEFGSAKNIAQAPLRRAADAVCDGWKPASKGSK